MDDAVRVRVAERGGDLPRDRECVVDAKLLLAVHGDAKRFALNVGHDEEQKAVGLAGIVEWENARMIQARDDVDLAQKSIRADRRGELRVQNLQRDVPMVFHVVGEIDRRHAAAADLALDAIASGQRALETAEGVVHVRPLLRMRRVSRGSSPLRTGNLAGSGAPVTHAPEARITGC